MIVNKLGTCITFFLVDKTVILLFSESLDNLKAGRRPKILIILLKILLL